MTNMKHTPGVWLAKHCPDCANEDSTLTPTVGMKRAIFAQRHDEQNRRVTQVLAEVYEQAAHPEQGQANTRLIAAAPELLKACEQAKNYLQTDLVEPGRSVFWSLVAAIAKATGQTA